MSMAWLERSPDPIAVSDVSPFFRVDLLRPTMPRLLQTFLRLDSPTSFLDRSSRLLA